MLDHRHERRTFYFVAKKPSSEKVLFSTLFNLFSISILYIVWCEGDNRFITKQVETKSRENYRVFNLYVYVCMYVYPNTRNLERDKNEVTT